MPRREQAKERAAKLGMEMEWIDPAELRPDDRNPVRHDERNIREVMRSLEEFGQHAPLVAQRGSRRVIVGNARLEAARRLGWEKVWVLWVEDDDIQAFRRGMADNKTGELSEWNTDALRSILEELAAEGEANVPGFEAEEIDKMLSSISIADMEVDFSSYEGSGKEERADDEVLQCPKCGFKFRAQGGAAGARGRGQAGHPF